MMFKCNHKISKTAQTLFLSFLLMLNLPLSAAEILFAYVHETTYYERGENLQEHLADAGHSVTGVFLNQAKYSDLSMYDQIFVYDSSHDSDNSENLMYNYQSIANWYNSLSQKNIIVDGRIMLSSDFFTSHNKMPRENTWVQNYANQIEQRGKGLVLGTDYSNYHDGIDEINALIGIDLFYGLSKDGKATVDPLSPLLISGLSNCPDNAERHCINNTKNRSLVPTGLQANGQFLTPVAYVGSEADAWSEAVISSSMGSLTFGSCGAPGQSPCGVSEPYGLAILGVGLLGLTIRRKINLKTTETIS